MVSVDAAVVAKITRNGETFEILVDPEKALAYRRGQQYSIESLLAVNQVFKDSKKGDRASSSDLEKAFGSTDTFKVAESILKHGELQLTTEQRRKMVEEKRLQVANYISKQGVDPKTKLPHPVQRILNAMEEARVNIDPFKPADQQSKDIVEAIRPIIPISIERLEVAIRIPMQYAGKASAVVHKMAPVQKEEWKSDSWIAVIEIPAGMQADIYQRLNDLTAGTVEVKIVKEIKA